jgi:dTDP-4-dehydrorhamnose 3,5-epimerase
MLWVPPGLAHGFQVLSDTAHVIYKTTDFYYPEFERTLAWNDPRLNIGWQAADPLVSPKDALGALFEQAEKFD